MANDVSAPLPDLDWPDQAIIAVDAGDASAKITRLVIHLSQDVPQEVADSLVLNPLLAYGPTAVEIG